MISSQTMKDIITQQPIDYDCALGSPERLFTDDHWCAQEKLDGIKVVLFSDRGNLSGVSRAGRPVWLSAKTRALMPTHGTFVIEGEQGNRLTGDTGFVAFDVLAVDCEDKRHLEYDDRLALLATLKVPMIETKLCMANKRRLYKDVLAKGGEGIVFKRLDAKYRPGKTSVQLKLKNWKSDTFRVLSVDGLGVELSTLAGAPAGRCAGYAQPGQLVEVRFQEITEAGKLRCPVMLNVRGDL
jgi:ATP-dependent DNA ligase